MFTQAMVGILALALVSGAIAAEPETGLLENGGFEMAKGTLPAAWRTIHPPGLARAPDFARAAKGAHTGEACASLSAHEATGYSSFTQIVDAPAGATLARLEGWIRVEAEAVKATLILIFFDPDRPETEKLLQTTGKLEAGTWKRVEIEAPVPAGATKWMVRCGIQGAGSASFDDISLTASKEKLDLVPATPAVGRGRYFLVPRADKGDCWVELSIPFPFEMQTPLALRVKSDP